MLVMHFRVWRAWDSSGGGLHLPRGMFRTGVCRITAAAAAGASSAVAAVVAISMVVVLVQVARVSSVLKQAINSIARAYP